jgi:hypothetical protein
MVQYLGSGGSRQGLKVVSGPRTGDRTYEAVFDGGISTVANERWVLHIRCVLHIH